MESHNKAKRSRATIAALVLTVLLPSLSGCATIYAWDGLEGPYYAGMSIDPRESRPVLMIIAVPFTMLWDGLTFPFQVGLGYYPYGDEGKHPYRASYQVTKKDPNSKP